MLGPELEPKTLDAAVSNFGSGFTNLAGNTTNHAEFISQLSWQSCAE